MSDLVSINSEIRRLSFRSKFLFYRQSARRVLDKFHFGEGTAARLGASAAFGGLISLLAIIISIASSTQSSYGISFSIFVLLIAWGTCAILVFGANDNDLKKEIALLNSNIYDKKIKRAELQREEEFAQDEDYIEDSRRSRSKKPTKIRCEYCDEVISILAVKCKYCGEILDESLRKERIRESETFFLVPMFLSWWLPGLGQIAKGQVLRGFTFFGLVMLGTMCCLVPGIVFQVINVFDAATHPRS